LILASAISQSAIVMARSVKLDDQKPLPTEEVNDVISNRNLPRKLVASESSISQPGPEKLFWMGLITA
jgi:hypothetical protein